MINRLIESDKQSLPYKYLVVWGMSERKIGYTDDISSKVDWDEMTEYRCFDENGEVHGIKKEGKLYLREIVDSDEDESILLKYPLVGKAKSLGHAFQVKRYISYDEDGQATIIASRCYSVVKGV